MQKNWIIRKLLAAFFSTSIVSIILAYGFTLAESKSLPHELGSSFFGWFLVCFIYSGAVIFVYGGLVSTVLELIHTKRTKISPSLYLCLHVMFGLAFGLFTLGAGTFVGGGVALIFGLIDLWLKQPKKKIPRKSVTLATPIVLVAGITLVFAMMSPDRPPFTKEEAILAAHDARSVDYDHFPTEEGAWTGEINGYDVRQEVTVEETEDEIYLVTFREMWEKGEDEGSWHWSYEIRRDGMSSKGGHDATPGYYK
ncbi:hypothetical protein [Alkalicoccobacillus murimartini]|uniref:Uncharacterized protein n=1 Tax=Alkalicoccobacillus murimartini TaxID=171685 RepID=A0ABT9YI08_9BACI|nr:hypothetical protein [Alkalicoccobacillus murimartini]MDQ0207324.1 hypothetical protein [Alkalicoccobacillus murimartini]